MRIDLLLCFIKVNIINKNININIMLKLNKTPKQLERYFKGLANHHRIEILLLLYNDDGLILEDITNSLGINFRTASEHTRRLVQAGLINKKYNGRQVRHSLSPYGKLCIKFLEQFS